MSFLRATYFAAPVFQVSTMYNVKQLHNDILSALSSNSLASIHLSTSEPSDFCWSIDSYGFLGLDDHIYVPDANDLQLHVLQYKHDHLLSRNFRQNWTLELICHKYTWPGVRTFVKEYVSFCTTCACAKVPRYKPFGLLKQWRGHGIPSLWISLSNSPIPLDTPQSS